MDLWLAGGCGLFLGITIGFWVSRIHIWRRFDREFLTHRSWRELVERYS